MTRQEIFSQFANQASYGCGCVYASRGIVNVIIPGTGYRGEGNHHYHRPGGPVSLWLKDLIIHTGRTAGLPAHRADWAKPGWDVTVRPHPIERGRYEFTVWMPKDQRPLAGVHPGTTKDISHPQQTGSK